MEQFLIYQLKVAVLLAMSFLLYRLLLSKLTFHSFNRKVLLLILLLSFCVPAVRLTLPERFHDIIPVGAIMADDNAQEEESFSDGMQAAELTSQSEMQETASVIEYDSYAEPEPVNMSWNWVLILFVVYCLGVAFCLVRKAFSVREIMRIIKDGEYRNRIEGCDLIESDLVSQPVSWMRCIVMPRQWLEMENKAVWQHESLHARKWHSLDLLLTDVISAVQWFNPAMRPVQMEMELIHEYEADRSVIESGTAENDYKTMLVGTLAANHGYPMSSWLRETNLKKRIDMMERSESRPLSRLRSLAILLLAAVFMVFNSGYAAAAPDGYPVFEDGRVWIFGDGTAKVRTFDGVEATVKSGDIADYLHKYRKFKTTRMSLRYMDDDSITLEKVQPLAEQLDRYGIKVSVAVDDYMLEHMTMPEYRRPHIIDLGGGQYRFEMNCELQDELRYSWAYPDRKYRTLSITGDLDLMNRWIGMFDGHGIAIYPHDMPWSDAISMAQAAWKRGIDQVAVVYDDPSPAADLTGLPDMYQMYKGDMGPHSITLIPQKPKIDAKSGEKALDVMSRLNASVSSDWFDKGVRIQNPRNQYNQNSPWLHITNVIRTEKETVLLFYSFQGNDLWLTSMTGYSLRANGKEYKEIGHYGLEGFDDKYFWSPESGYYYFALTYPALPDDVSTVDLIDSEEGSVCVRGLQVSDKGPEQDDSFTMLLYDRYELKTINIHKDIPDVVRATTAHLTGTETVVYMEMSIMEPHSVKGYVGSDFTLTFSNGRELKPLRFEGVKTDQDFDRGGDHVSNYFQIVFPASKPREWMEGAVLKGVICHEPITLEIVSGLQMNGQENDVDYVNRALGVSLPPEKQKESDEYRELLKQTVLSVPENELTAEQLEMKVKVMDFMMTNVSMEGIHQVLTVSREEMESQGIPSVYYDIIRHQIKETNEYVDEMIEEGLVSSDDPKLRKDFDEAVERYWKEERQELLRYNADGPLLQTHEYVDLGLSVKWATCNIGAVTPEDHGGYYAWAETEEKGDYSWLTYAHCYGTGSTLTKYCNDTSKGKDGFHDEICFISPDDDVAYKNWGDRWRIPTAAEWAELMDSENCTWTWTSRNDVSGYEIKSNKSGFTGNSIFLPAAWCMVNSSLNNSFAQSDPSTAIGYYWSSSLYEPDPSRALFISITSGNNINSNFRNRYTGLTIRPVCK